MSLKASQWGCVGIMPQRYLAFPSNINSMVCLHMQEYTRERAHQLSLSFEKNQLETMFVNRQLLSFSSSVSKCRS